MLSGWFGWPCGCWVSRMRSALWLSLGNRGRQEGRSVVRDQGSRFGGSRGRSPDEEGQLRGSLLPAQVSL